MFNLLKKEKLYKFVYDKSSGYSSDRNLTLLVVASSTTDAVKKFYKLTDNKVSNIHEFTEIKYPEGDEISSGK